VFWPRKALVVVLPGIGPHRAKPLAGRLQALRTLGYFPSLGPTWRGFEPSSSPSARMSMKSRSSTGFWLKPPAEHRSGGCRAAFRWPSRKRQPSPKTAPAAPFRNVGAPSLNGPEAAFRGSIRGTLTNTVNGYKPLTPSLYQASSTGSAATRSRRFRHCTILINVLEALVTKASSAATLSLSFGVPLIP
jgi:hypothetical protein